MNEQNGKTPMWLWITLIVVILAGIGFFAWAYFDSKNHTVQPDKATLDAINNDTTPTVADDATDVLKADDNNTADWKTYENTAYGYSVKYPTNWTVNSAKVGGVIFDNPTVDSVESNLIINYHDNISDASFNDSKATSLADMMKDTNTFKNTKVIKVGDISGYETFVGGVGAYYIIYLEKDNHIYELYFSNIENKDSITATNSSIINSFQFTK